MKFYFQNPKHVARLRAAADSWRDTPFRFGSKAKGISGGTDCVGLVESLLFESGALPSFEFPRRPRDMSPHVRNNRILDYLRGKINDQQSKALAKRFMELPKDTELMPGDVLILRKANADLFHLPIVIDPPRCAHCLGAGVGECDATDPNIADRIVSVFRVKL